MRIQTIAKLTVLAVATAACACGGTENPSPVTAAVPGGSPDKGAPSIPVLEAGAQDGGAPQDARAEASPEPILPPSGLEIGATVRGNGTLFRVWAPNATQASVSGDFAGGALVPLAKESNGLFAGLVAGARAGQRYRFTFTTKGQTFLRSDPRARALDSAFGESIIVDPQAYAWKTPPFSTPSLAEAILYELHVPSFNVLPGQANGTFLSAIEKLDHLKALGVNVIELMPSTQFRGTVSWGYNPTAFFAPHVTYGTPDDLRRFVDEAHARGIGVVLDIVNNHTDRAQKGMWCFDGECPSNNGIYYFSDATYAMTPWGPRPDFSRKEVADVLVDSLFTWLSEYRMDGFRWDSTSNIRAIDGTGSVPGGRDLMANANDVLHARFPRAIFIAEDLKGHAPITGTTASGGMGFDAQWDGFYYNVKPAVAEASDAARNVNAVRDAIAFRYNDVGTQRVIFTETHDLAGNGGSRLPKTIDAKDPTSKQARKGSMLAIASALMSPGIPMLLQGQELLQVESWTNNLTPPVRWDDATAQAPVLAFYRDMLRLRRNLDGTSRGLLGQNVNVFHVNAPSKVLAWQRWGTPGDDVVIVANFSATLFTSYHLGFPGPGVWRVRFNGDSRRYSSDFGDTVVSDVTASSNPMDGLAAKGTIVLPPYAMVVLSR